MLFYGILLDQGIKNLKECIHSIEIFKGYIERMGNKYHGTYYSFGHTMQCHWWIG